VGLFRKKQESKTFSQVFKYLPAEFPYLQTAPYKSPFRSVTDSDFLDSEQLEYENAFLSSMFTEVITKFDETISNNPPIDFNDPSNASFENENSFFGAIVAATGVDPVPLTKPFLTATMLAARAAQIEATDVGIVSGQYEVHVVDSLRRVLEIHASRDGYRALYFFAADALLYPMHVLGLQSEGTEKIVDSLRKFAVDNAQTLVSK